MYSTLDSLYTALTIHSIAGGNWATFKQPQSQCWSGRWGSHDGLYFGGVSCNIVNVTAELFNGSPTLFNGSPTLSPAEILGEVTTGEWAPNVASAESVVDPYLA
jgi:hypothetical protein